MSGKKKDALYYSREDLTGMGPSQIQVFEVKNPGQTITLNMNGKLITLKSVNVQGTNYPIKPYVFIERYRNIDLTTVDIIYGNMDIPGLKKDERSRNKLFEEILTRENLELITRKYCGLIPNITTGLYGNSQLRYDQDSMKALAKAVFSSAYLENRQTSIKMNSNGSKNSRSKKRSFWDRIFGSPDGENKEQSSQTSVGDYQGRTTYTRNEGVLFYRTGVVIFNKATYLKFNYATKDNETGVQTEVNSFLISDFNEDRLRTDEKYRKTFVQDVLSPSRLKNARSVEMFPFIGEFTNSGQFQNNIEVWAAFDQLNKGYR